MSSSKKSINKTFNYFLSLSQTKMADPIFRGPNYLAWISKIKSLRCGKVHRDYQFTE
jgi:hypothetical protein